MKKILYVYFEPQVSGQTTHVLSLVNGLNKDKYDITVVLPSHLLQAISAFEQSCVMVVPLPMRKVAWNASSTASLINLIRGQKFDIVHVHSQEAGLLVRIFAWAAGAKHIIYTPQCTDIRRTHWFWLYRSIEKLLSIITSKIISVSEIDRNRIIKWGIPASKVITIYNGIDPSMIEDASDIKKGQDSLVMDWQPPLVMQVGRLSYQKNPFAFVKGAAQVIKEIPVVHFLLVGDGPLRNEVESYIKKLGIQDNVHCLGWQEEADKMIPAAEVITLTSRWEGLPYVLLEAMACSRPIVTTRVNGCPELVENGVTGFVVPKDDVTAWANSVIAILKDNQRSKKMGQKGNKRLREYFSLEKLIKETEGLYDTLTANA